MNEDSPDDPLRAIVADDDPFVRHLVKDALRAAGIVVVAEAGNGREAVELTRHYHPDVVFMDVVMPELDGISATRALVTETPDQLVILLTGSDDDELVVLGLRAGAVGFLTKSQPVDALPRAFHAVVRGEAAISRELTKRLIGHLRNLPERSAGMRPIESPLTNREWEVVGLLADELSNAEIADTLVVSLATVRSHVKNILRKLQVNSRQDAVVVAERIREGSA